uniref:BTB domain-containing protein n=1 Tax=Panagrolaimus davidi TaxID=227884 RepID=A0A914PUC8_9BILA
MRLANDCQIKMKWRIKEDALKKAINKSNTTIKESPHFKAPKILGVEYYLSLQIDEDDPNEINLILYLGFEMASKIDATFTLSVKSASYKERVEDIYDTTGGWGRTLCNRDELFDPEKKFFVNEIMEIELEGTLKSLGIKRKAPESSSLADILWENEEGKDVTIAVNGQELKVRNNIICSIVDCLIQIHKWILCGKSPVFKAELNSGMNEARENRIEIHDFKFETVEIAIKHCYEQEIKEFISEKNASELLHFAHNYNIELLHHIVQFTLIDKISESNVVQLANASVTSNAKELREFCVCLLMDAVDKSIIIEDATKLRDEIFTEIGQRSLFSIVE